MYSLLTEQPASNPVAVMIAKAVKLYVQKTGHTPTDVQVNINEQTLHIHGEVYKMSEI